MILVESLYACLCTTSGCTYRRVCTGHSYLGCDLNKHHTLNSPASPRGCPFLEYGRDHKSIFLRIYSSPGRLSSRSSSSNPNDATQSSASQSVSTAFHQAQPWRPICVHSNGARQSCPRPLESTARRPEEVWRVSHLSFSSLSLFLSRGVTAAAVDIESVKWDGRHLPPSLRTDTSIVAVVYLSWFPEALIKKWWQDISLGKKRHEV